MKITHRIISIVGKAMALVESENCLLKAAGGVVRGLGKRNLGREPRSQLYFPQPFEGLVDKNRKQPFALPQKDPDELKGLN